jgi:hypothetical protein
MEQTAPLRGRSARLEREDDMTTKDTDISTTRRSLLFSGAALAGLFAAPLVPAAFGGRLETIGSALARDGADDGPDDDGNHSGGDDSEDDDDSSDDDDSDDDDDDDDDDATAVTRAATSTAAAIITVPITPEQD